MTEPQYKILSFADFSFVGAAIHDDDIGETMFLRALEAVQSVAWWHLFPFKLGDRVMLTGEPRDRNSMTAKRYARAGTVVRVRKSSTAWWMGNFSVHWDGKKLPEYEWHGHLEPDDPAVRAARVAKVKGPRMKPFLARTIAAVEKAITEHADAETIARAAIDAYRNKG